MVFDKVAQQAQQPTQPAGQDIAITLYTDPLCCWSWVFQPVLQRLQESLDARASWQLRMGGLIPNWSNFTDEANAVSKPAQMGPVWMHAGQIAVRPIQHQLWHLDPPVSSYPACIAVKCAQLQWPAFGFQMQAALQTACMEEGNNIARRDVLFNVATAFSTREPAFSLSQFTKDFNEGRGAAALRADLDAVHADRITRFPSLLVRAHGSALLIPGCNDYSTIMDAISRLVPDL